MRAGAARTRGNANHILRTGSPALAELVRRRESALMWGDGPGSATGSLFGRGGEARPSTAPGDGKRRRCGWSSPLTPRGASPGTVELIAAALRRATRQLGMALFAFSAQSITEAIADRVAAGVVVKLAADPGFATSSFSEVLDLLGIALPGPALLRDRTDNAPLDTPLQGVGTPPGWHMATSCATSPP